MGEDEREREGEMETGEETTKRRKAGDGARGSEWVAFGCGALSKVRTGVVLPLRVRRWARARVMVACLVRGGCVPRGKV